jgi:hypothetical protein
LQVDLKTGPSTNSRAASRLSSFSLLKSGVNIPPVHPWPCHPSIIFIHFALAAGSHLPEKEREAAPGTPALWNNVHIFYKNVLDANHT